MKKILLLFSFIALLFQANAQEKATIKVEYTHKFQNWTTGAMIEKRLILLANDSLSHYYSPTALIVDSMLSTPQGAQQYDQMVEAANQAGQRPALLPGPRTYVIKNRPEEKISHYDSYAGELGHYSENMSEQKWEVSDSTSTILGYECYLAEGDYHGRHWKLWFTPEIPISDGPWKFTGLPGLILRADDTTGNYIFEATGVENSDMSFPSKMYGHELSEAISRKNLLRTQWNFYNNIDGQSTADGMGISNLSDPLPEGFDLIETDYK
ncbi:MAG: GLPGLI family protein [Muribaculaceae bacterium]|nr:GLPGLI family protein [Muribaculaceae bacterium]